MNNRTNRLKIAGIKPEFKTSSSEKSCPLTSVNPLDSAERILIYRRKANEREFYERYRFEEEPSQ